MSARSWPRSVGRRAFGALVAIRLLGGPMLAESVPSGFARLQQALTDRGFAVRLELPPLRGAYGLLAVKTKTIYINPVVFELGNAEAVLIHEAVHAAQWCAGGGSELRTLNLEIPPPVLTRRFYLRYHTLRRQLEAEAYTVPAQPDGLEVVLGLLQKHCGDAENP